MTTRLAGADRDGAVTGAEAAITRSAWSAAKGPEAEVVLYAGGWADVGLVTSSMTWPEQEYHELENSDEFGALLDRVVSRLLASS